MKRRAIYALSIAAMLVIAGCSASPPRPAFTESTQPMTTPGPSTPTDAVDDPPESDGSRLPPVPPSSEPSPFGPADYPDDSAGRVATAINDLAVRLNLDAIDIAVVRVEEIEWPDAALGCSEPGMNYAQVVTAGLRIVLDGQGDVYSYHSGGSVEPFLCVQNL